MTLSRRSFLSGLGALIAAPAVIRIPGLLMPVKAIVTDGVALTNIDHPRTLYVGAWALADAVGLPRFDTIANALAAAEPNDRIMVAADHVEVVPLGGIQINQPNLALLGAGNGARRPRLITHGAAFSVRSGPVAIHNFTLASY